MGVALGARKSAEKLSDSLVNNPLWVNNRVRTGPHFRRFELPGLSEGKDNMGRARVPARSVAMSFDSAPGILYIVVRREDGSFMSFSQ